MALLTPGGKTGRLAQCLGNTEQPSRAFSLNLTSGTTAAGPGSSGSVTNVVPRQVAMDEDANQQITAGSFSDRKRLTGSQKRKLRRQALRVNEAASGAAAAQSPEAGRVAPRRGNGSKDTPRKG